MNGKQIILAHYTAVIKAHWGQDKMVVIFMTKFSSYHNRLGYPYPLCLYYFR